MKHEDSVELIVERDGAAGAAIASSSAVFVAGFALSSLLTRQVVPVLLSHWPPAATPLFLTGDVRSPQRGFGADPRVLVSECIPHCNIR